MNVAPATSTVSRPFSFMTAHGGDTAVTRAEAQTPAAATDSEPLVNRFPSIAFSYDVDASRLVMLYRDPANGKTVSQIPTETALKQYKEAQQQEKRAATLAVTVGGAADAQGGGTGTGASGKNGVGTPTTTTTGVSVAAKSSSAAVHSVAQFSPTTTHPAAVSAGVARVNVVI